MTNRSLLFAGLMALMLLIMAPSAWGQGACIDFEAPAFAMGTSYGTPVGQVPGDLAFNYAGIDAYVARILYGGGSLGFNYARITPAPPTLGPSQSLRFNNIDMVFDYSSWGTLPTKVVFDYADLGGLENLSINGSPVFVGDIWNAPAVIGGVNVTVTKIVTPGGCTGRVTLDGTVQHFRVGGQEFWIDDLCATP